MQTPKPESKAYHFEESSKISSNFRGAKRRRVDVNVIHWNLYHGKLSARVKFVPREGGSGVYNDIFLNTDNKLHKNFKTTKTGQKKNLVEVKISNHVLRHVLRSRFFQIKLGIKYGGTIKVKAMYF